jgi:hypothetical protein
MTNLLMLRKGIDSLEVLSDVLYYQNLVDTFLKFIWNFSTSIWYFSCIVTVQVG